MKITNSGGSGDYPLGDCLWLESTSEDDHRFTTVLRVLTWNGAAAVFSKLQDNPQDVDYAVSIHAEDADAEGLYVDGTIDATGSISKGVQTGRGIEPVFCVGAPQDEIFYSGDARLSGGTAHVVFDRLFAESVSSEVEVRVTVTPVGAWSALYLTSTSPEGFDVRSADGDENAEFHWMACGRRKGYETRPEVIIPDPEEERRIREQKQRARGQ